MSIETNKEVVRRLTEAMLRGDQDEIGNLIAEDVVYHNPPLDHGAGPEGRKEFTKKLQTVFPQHDATLEDVIAEGDKVAVRWVTRGRHEGTHTNHPWNNEPTGKEIAVSGITIYRIADGKIAESWTNWDDAYLVEQLQSPSKA